MPPSVVEGQVRTEKRQGRVRHRVDKRIDQRRARRRQAVVIAAERHRREIDRQASEPREPVRLQTAAHHELRHAPGALRGFDDDFVRAFIDTLHFGVEHQRASVAASCSASAWRRRG